MARAGHKIHPYIHWALGDGNNHFWEDIWWRDKPISELCNPGMRLPQRKVKDFWRNGSWDVALVRRELEPLGVPREATDEIVRTPVEYGGRDTLRWIKTPNGNFSTNSAWEEIRHRQPPMQIFKLIWNDCILSSTSIFVWRLLANRIPVDAKLQWRKVKLASKCRCCRAPAIETREHLFLQGEVATQVWGNIGNWFPNLPRWNAVNIDLEKRIKFWHRWLCRSNKPHVSSIIPCLALWVIWSERNGKIHRGTLFTAETVLNQIRQHLQPLSTAGRLGKEQWRGCSIPKEINISAWREKPSKRHRLVRWFPPDADWIKLNTMGQWSTAGTGTGGIIRDKDGNMIRCFASKSSATSHLEAELQAIGLGLDMVGTGSQRIWIEMGNSEVVDILMAKKHGPAILRHQVSEIRNKIKQFCTKVSYIQKEGNKVAACLAQQGSMEPNCIFFDQHTAPAIVKATLRMDQLGLPNFPMD